jgi:hypothetical protein
MPNINAIIEIFSKVILKKPLISQKILEVTQLYQYTNVG